MKNKINHILAIMAFVTLSLSFPDYVFGQGQIKRPQKKETQTSIKISSPDDYINGHGYVDLGLPSGLKWATCNVGATKPSGYGNYYAWGETSPKSNYTWSNCFDCRDNNGDNWGIYKIGGNLQISPTSGHDTARENWGKMWRMPTDTEFQELIDHCKWIWVKVDGHNGYIVTGSNGKNIFFPATGQRGGTELNLVGEEGSYWTSTLNRNLSSSARVLGIGSWYHDVFHTCNGSEIDKLLLSNRYMGLSVRPVLCNFVE